LQTRKSPIRQLSLELQPECTSGGKFKRKEHLKRRVDITRVFRKGRAVSCTGVKLFFLANDLPINRIAISFVRKYGNAVRRNRARRLGREAYRLMKDQLKSGFDLILLLYPIGVNEAGVNRGSLAASSEQLKTLFGKAGLYRIKV